MATFFNFFFFLTTKTKKLKTTKTSSCSQKTFFEDSFAKQNQNTWKMLLVLFFFQKARKKKRKGKKQGTKKNQHSLFPHKAALRWQHHLWFEKKSPQNKKKQTYCLIRWFFFLQNQNGLPKLFMEPLLLKMQGLRWHFGIPPAKFDRILNFEMTS